MLNNFNRLTDPCRFRITVLAVKRWCYTTSNNRIRMRLKRFIILAYDNRSDRPLDAPHPIASGFTY